MLKKTIDLLENSNSKLQEIKEALERVQSDINFLNSNGFNFVVTTKSKSNSLS